MDDAGRVLDVCEIGDDSYGYAYLSSLLAERATGPYSVAIATNGGQRLVPRLLATAGWALAMIDDEATDDFAERFADEFQDDAASTPTQRRALGLARALQGGALSAALQPAPAELASLKPVLATLGTLATGRHAASMALREVLRELYPAALRAYPDPADPVALAVMDALPEPGMLGSSASSRGRDAAAAADTVAGRLAATGLADQAAITEAITALRVAIAETPRRSGISRSLTPTVAETVRQTVAAVRAYDMASTALVKALAERAAPSRHAAAPTSAVPAPATVPVPTGHAGVPAAVNPAPPVATPTRPTAIPRATRVPVTASSASAAPQPPPMPAPPPAPPRQPAAPIPTPIPPLRQPAPAAMHPQGTTAPHGTFPLPPPQPISAAPPPPQPMTSVPPPPQPMMSPPAAPHPTNPLPGLSGPAPASPGPLLNGPGPLPTPPGPNPLGSNPPGPQHAAPVSSPGRGAVLPNRPVSIPPPPPPGITPISAPRAPLPTRTPGYSADQVRVPVPRPTLEGPPAGSRSDWPTRPPADDWAAAPPPRRADREPATNGTASHTSVTPPWRADDLKPPEPPEPPTLRLVEPTLPEELREELGLPAPRPSEPFRSTAPSEPFRSTGPSEPFRSTGLSEPFRSTAPGPGSHRSDSALPSRLDSHRSDPLRSNPDPLRSNPDPLRSDPLRSDAFRSAARSLRLVESNRNGAIPRSAPPVSADDDDTLLIFAETRSAWFTKDDEATWGSAMDLGWRAAEQAAQPTVGDRTDAGLPRRVPHANLVPGAPPRRDDRPLRVVRDAASIAENTSGYFSGWRRGQEVGGYPLGGRQRQPGAGAWEFHRDEDRLSG